MTNLEIGEYLKSKAKPSGSLLDISISNAYNTIDSLAYFFYNKKHEWYVICFLDSDYRCHKVWLEKGEDNSSVEPRITITKALRFAVRNNYKNLIVAHNHPVSKYAYSDTSRSIVKYGSGPDTKRRLLRLSEPDKDHYRNWVKRCNEMDLAVVFCVIVAGEIHAEGGVGILNNISKYTPQIRTFKKKINRKVKYSASNVKYYPPVDYTKIRTWRYGNSNDCFIASAIYGIEAEETIMLRHFRDKILLKSYLGYLFCMVYYQISPLIARLLKRSDFLKELSIRIMKPILAIVRQIINQKNVL